MRNRLVVGIAIVAAAIGALALPVSAENVALHPYEEDVDQPGVEYRVSVDPAFHPAEPAHAQPGDVRSGFGYRAVPQALRLSEIADGVSAGTILTLTQLRQSNAMWNVERLDLVLNRGGRHWSERWVSVAGIGGQTAEAMARARVDQLVACAEGRSLCDEPIRVSFVKHRDLLQSGDAHATVVALITNRLTPVNNAGGVSGNSLIRSLGQNPPVQDPPAEDPPETAESNDGAQGADSGAQATVDPTSQDPCTDAISATISGSLVFDTTNTDWTKHTVTATWTAPVNLHSSHRVLNWWVQAWYGRPGPPKVTVSRATTDRQWSGNLYWDANDSESRLTKVRIMGVCSCTYTVNGQTINRNGPYLYLP